MKFGIAITTLAAVSIIGMSGAQVAPQHGGAMMKKSGHMMSKADWQKMYDKAAAMFDAMKPEALFSYMTPDFTMTMNGKTSNLEESKKGMTQWVSMMRNMHCSMMVKSVSPGRDGSTVVTSTYHNWGMTKPQGKGKKSSKFEEKGTDMSTWVNMHGKWMMKRMVSNGSMTMDGKPIKM